MTTPHTPPARMVLKHGRAMPFIYRHPWVFTGSVRKIEGSCANGDVVAVVGERGDFIGWGLYSADSQIAARLISWNPDETVDDAFLRDRVARAVHLRERTVPLTEHQTARRVVFSEADGLPGLIADQYGDWLVVQFLSFGLDRRRDALLDALEAELQPRGIYERSDVAVRTKEGLPSQAGPVRGAEPPEQIVIRDGGVAFEVDVRRGHKTGHYLDQRRNRAVVAEFAPGRRVLDAFCYTGGFGLAAALHGAESVVCVDAAQPALDAARRNAERNGCDNIAFVREHVKRHLTAEPAGSFDLVVLDPPGFAKSSHGVQKALQSYRTLYAASLRLLRPDGVLVGCCCSQHIGPGDVLGAINAAAVDTNRSVHVLHVLGQPPDHPVAANCPETAYLKCLVCWVD